jgi:hypothetical protein
VFFLAGNLTMYLPAKLRFFFQKLSGVHVYTRVLYWLSGSAPLNTAISSLNLFLASAVVLPWRNEAAFCLCIV